MIKNKLIKINSLLILILILLNIYNPTQTDASSSVYTGKINSQTIFNSEYSFTPKFIKGITTTTSYGMTNYKVDFLRSDSLQMTSDKYYSARLTSNLQKGKIWVRYNNVGTYNGQVIDLKITLMNWNYLQPANLSASEVIGGVNYPTVLFNKDAIDVSITTFPAVDSPVWNFTFYKNNTNNIISVKNHITFKDVDGGFNGANEEITFTSGFDSIYASQNSNIIFTSNHCINNSSTATSSNDKSAWVTCLNSGSNLTFTYTRNKDTLGNPYKDITKVVSGTTRNFYHFLIGSESLAPFEFTNPNKQVNREKIRGIEELTYTISQFIPGETSDYYYTSYALTDKIADCFEIEKIYISDDTKIDRTSWFTVSYDKNNLITISATNNALKNSSFYNNNIYFNIKVRKKADKDMLKWYNENNSMCTVPNNANITISSPTSSGNRTKKLTTNTVNVNIYREFELPEAGGHGGIYFIITGIIFILISSILNLKSESKRYINEN